MNRVVVIGAGFGGLAAAAELAKAGLDVTVLEAHVYPGGCAGTFFHQGYKFDAGATLAGGFADGAPMQFLGERLGIDWEEKPLNKAMVVHLPDGKMVTRWTDQTGWMDERNSIFGPTAEPFWHWQEKTADGMWDLALRRPIWPPLSLHDAGRLMKTGAAWIGDWMRYSNLNIIAGSLRNSFQTVASQMRNPTNFLRLYVDGQLLIASQATSQRVNALYGAAALDLPRRGVAHVPGGMGGMAHKLVQAIQKMGGSVLMRQEVNRVSRCADGTYRILTKRKRQFNAHKVLFNLTPGRAASIIEDGVLQRELLKHKIPGDGWGAFVLYAGMDDNIIPQDFTEHQQVIQSEPLGEGNSIFMSISPHWDKTRAPEGRRALTISTHTRLDKWWRVFRSDRIEYKERIDRYTDRMLRATERALPGVSSSIDLLLPGTPVTFERFTGREKGWVGGFPQTNLFRTVPARIAPGIRLVGDSVFPGQSIPAVVLGGINSAKTVLEEIGRENKRAWFSKANKIPEQCVESG